MSSLLEGELAQIVSDGLESGDLPYGITVTRTIPGSVEPPHSVFSPGPATTVNYPCRGFEDSYSLFDRQNTLIQAADVKVCILVPSLSIEPKTGDTVTVRGRTLNVIDVKTDPARAMWTLQSRA